MTDTARKHVTVRESTLGRWLPVFFYALNVILWALTGIFYELWDLLYLVILTVPALALYIWRTR